MVLKLYKSVAAELKLKVRRFWGLNTTFAEVAGEKLAIVNMANNKVQMIFTFSRFTEFYVFRIFERDL